MSTLEVMRQVAGTSAAVWPWTSGRWSAIGRKLASILQPKRWHQKSGSHLPQIVFFFVQSWHAGPNCIWQSAPPPCKKILHFHLYLVKYFWVFNIHPWSAHLSVVFPWFSTNLSWNAVVMSFTNDITKNFGFFDHLPAIVGTNYMQFFFRSRPTPPSQLMSFVNGPLPDVNKPGGRLNRHFWRP